jgi:hypothetical protein
VNQPVNACHVYEVGDAALEAAFEQATGRRRCGKLDHGKRPARRVK